MTQQANGIRTGQDPEGSIFLFETLTREAYDRERFAMLMNQGVYRGVESEELERIDEMFRFRLAITKRMADAAINASGRV